VVYTTFLGGTIAVFNTAPFVMVGFDKHDYDVMKPPINRTGSRNILAPQSMRVQ